MNRIEHTAPDTATPWLMLPETGGPETIHDDRFHQLLGDRDWHILPPAISRRFSKRLVGGASVAYQGSVRLMRFNAAGRFLAVLTRLVGAPLPFDPASVGRPAVVVVTEDPASNGQFWLRQYGRSTGFPQTVHSSKRFCGPTGLEEHIGYGIGMTLRLEATPEALWFVSERYFVDLGGLRLNLPRWLCPGQLIVGHREISADRFIFSLELNHPIFGQLILQEAVFQDGEVFDGGQADDQSHLVS